MSIRDEREIMSSGNDALVLTTHRVRYKTKALGAANFISVMLDQIASVSVGYRSQPLLILIAIVLVGLGLAFGSTLLGILVAVVPVVAFFVTRRLTMVLATGGDNLALQLKGMPIENAIEFVDAVEAARDEYIRRR